MPDRSSIDKPIVAAHPEGGVGEPATEKNPAAVALGKLGGIKGGRARARSLSARRRSEIARKAARARWDKAEPT